MKKSAFKLRTGFLCDDVRREDNGKYLFIGGYEHNVLFPMFPASHVFSIVILGESTKPHKFDLKLRVRFNEEVIREGGGEVDVAHAGQTMLCLKGILLQLKHEGMMSFDMRQSDPGEWEPICSLTVSKRST